METKRDFVIDPDPKVEWPVTVRLPADGGRFEEFRFSATIRVLSEDGYNALVGNESEVESLSAILARNAEVLPKLVVGWNGPRTTSGEAVPFSPAALADQIKGPHGRALSTGFWRAVQEVRYGAALGNFAPPPDTGSD